MLRFAHLSVRLSLSLCPCTQLKNGTLLGYSHNRTNKTQSCRSNPLVSVSETGQACRDAVIGAMPCYWLHRVYTFSKRLSVLCTRLTNYKIGTSPLRIHRVSLYRVLVERYCTESRGGWIDMLQSGLVSGIATRISLL